MYFRDALLNNRSYNYPCKVQANITEYARLKIKPVYRDRHFWPTC